MQAGAVWWPVVVVVLAATAVRSEPVDLEPYCAGQDEGYYCATCMHSVYCKDDVTSIIQTCPVGKVCDGDLGYTFCVPMEEATKCQCNEYSQCDDYNPIYLNKCDEHGIYDVLACDNVGDTCNVGKCGPVVPGVDSCDDDGALIGEWNFITPDCTQGFYCYEAEPEFRVECEANEYIDINGDCQPAPPKPCASGCTGECPNNLDCTSYYFCENGQATHTIECRDGFFFNPKAEPVPKCEEGAEEFCPPLTFCEFSDGGFITPNTTTTTITTTTTPTTTTTTTPPTAPACTADSLGNYPSGPCSSFYWSCRYVGGGDYEAVLMQCNNGLIFDTDPTLPYCNQPENVATCDNNAADSSFLLH
ncbi:Chitin binding domain [Trinorchestia longiramus]|nr:Chitin binding domain [Trinorchestia longiramus]